MGENLQAQAAQFWEMSRPGGAELICFPPFRFDKEHCRLRQLVLSGQACEHMSLAARQLMKRAQVGEEPPRGVLRVLLLGLEIMNRQPYRGNDGDRHGGDDANTAPAKRPIAGPRLRLGCQECVHQERKAAIHGVTPTGVGGEAAGTAGSAAGGDLLPARGSSTVSRSASTT